MKNVYFAPSFIVNTLCPAGNNAVKGECGGFTAVDRTVKDRAVEEACLCNAQ